MTPRARNGLAALVLLLLAAGIVAGLVHGNGGKSTPTATGSGARQPATTVTVTVKTTTSPPSPLPSVSPTLPPTTIVAPITRQPRTGGPATLPIGLGLVAAGLLMLRVHRIAARQAGIAG